jgi:cyclic nucleotide-binding protein/sulfatase-like protein
MFGSFSQRVGVVRSYARKREIIREDDPATRVYEVISGTVCTAKMLRDGRRQVGGFYFSGDVFGLEAAVKHALTPFRNEKNSNWEGAFRVPAFVRWPGRIKPGSVANDIFSGLDWFPTLTAVAGDTGVKDRLLTGWQIGPTTYKVHLDGYNQLP